MEEIKVMVKPDWVSWDDIHELLLAAHKKNIEKGVVMNTTTMTGEGIKNYLGESGRCFVALCGDKLIGTTSVKIAVGKNWFDKGKTVAKGTMSAILKQYQGLGILEEMNELRDQYIADNSVRLLEADTAEENVMVRKILAKKGFKEVRFFPAKNQNHFSVYFVKWLEGCPFSDKFIQRKFNLSKVLTKIQYGPGKVERSRFLSRICQCIKKLINV
jgi:hypothetical protein